VRRVDSLARIVLPMQVRVKTGIGEKGAMTLHREGTRLYLRPLRGDASSALVTRALPNTEDAHSVGSARPILYDVLRRPCEPLTECAGTVRASLAHSIAITCWEGRDWVGMNNVDMVVTGDMLVIRVDLPKECSP